jgi:hypothetical protein
MGRPPFQTVQQEPINIFTISKPDSSTEFRDLQALLRSVCSKGVRTALTQNDYSHLMALISGYVLRWPGPVLARNPFAENQPVYEVSDFAQLQVVHLILQALLVEPGAIVQFVDQRFVCELVAQLDTPVVQEQGHIEFEIHSIVENFPGLAESTVNSLIRPALHRPCAFCIRIIRRTI